MVYFYIGGIMVFWMILEREKMTTANVKTTDGEIRGNIYETPGGRTYYSFTGIPYAEPPTGKLRFREPVPVKKWQGVLDATKEDTFFFQDDPIFNNFGGTETLVLNVYTPNLKTDGKVLPVMVYFHGGGFMTGTCKKESFGPDLLIEKDVVVVSVQYRLGLLGFLCLDIPEAPGNAGLKDQVLALKWVQKHIRTFNGDPTNVSIFGTSAGGASVDYHMLSPMSKNLFHKAIAISGNALNPWAISKNPNYFALRTAEVLGKDLKSKKEILDFLISANSEDIHEINRILFNECKEGSIGGLKYPFTPVIEKKFENVTRFLGRKPIDILKAGQQNILPYISGFSEQEGGILVVLRSKKLTDLQTNQNISTYLPFDINNNEKILKEIQSFYNDKETGRFNEISAIDFFGDGDFTGGILQSAKLQAITNPNVFLYNFAYVGAYNLSKSKENQMKILPDYFEPKEVSSHADLNGYITYVKAVADEASVKDNEVREQVLQMFTDFAKTGNPTPTTNSIVKTKWLPVEKNKINVLNIGDEIVVVNDDKRANLWERVYEYDTK